MSFRLLIECSKDIDKLQIDFTDGTSTTSGGTTSGKTIPDSGPVQNSQPKEYINTDETFKEQKQEIIELPDTTLEPRNPSVATELQNLDF